MSLINQVLREVDSRDNLDEDLDQIEAVSEQEKYIKVNSRTIFFILFGIFICTLLYVLAIKFIASMQNTQKQSQLVYQETTPNLDDKVVTVSQAKIPNMQKVVIEDANLDSNKIENLNSEFVQLINSLNVFPKHENIVVAGTDIALPPLDENINDIDKIDEIDTSNFDAVKTSIKKPLQKKIRLKSNKQVYRDAIQYFSEGFYIRAEGLLLDLLRRAPDHQKSLSLLTKYYYSSNQLTQAKSVLANYLPFQPSNQECLRFNVKIKYDLGEYASALNWLKKVNLHSNDTELLSMRAYLYQESGDFEQALVNYQMLVAIQPKKSIWWVGKGISELKLSKSQDALNSFGNAKKYGELSNEVTAFVDNQIKELIQG